MQQNSELFESRLAGLRSHNSHRLLRFIVQRLSEFNAQDFRKDLEKHQASELILPKARPAMGYLRTFCFDSRFGRVLAA